LRIFASSLSVALLNGFGLQVIQSGTALISLLPGAEFNVDVADPCSGIRSLFAMMALTAAYAHFSQRTPLQKWALFACSIPLAVFGNVMRILSICVVAHFFGQDVATGFYHDYSGYVVFLAGVALMVECGRWLTKLDPLVSKWGFLPGWLRYGIDVEAGDAGMRQPRFVALAICLLAMLLPVGLALLKHGMPAPVYDTVEFVSDGLPDRVQGYVSDKPWFCRNEQCLTMIEEQELIRKGGAGRDGYVCPVCGAKLYPSSLGEATVLPSDTSISKRDYTAPDGMRYSVSMVVAGRRRGSIHRPELCLPAQGYVMTRARTVPLNVAGGFPQRVRVITVQRTGAPAFSLAYWFFCRDRESCSHTDRIVSDIWDRSIRNRINRWVMLAVNVPFGLETSEDIKRFEEFLGGLAPQVHLKGKVEP